MGLICKIFAKMDDKMYKLCYVEDNILYFTDDFEHQWADGWDDAPYQHNAGTPYPKHRKIPGFSHGECQGYDKS